MDGSRASMAPAGRAGTDGGGTSAAATQFPAGLRVLVVDDDATCLKILEKMLHKCLYKVTTCSRAVEALSWLRERRGEFDLVLSDVYMPDMDGFKLLEHIGLEMDLPVIMMSAEDEKSVVMKGVTHGACDYLIKPVRMEALKNIWQHVVRKKRSELKELENSGSVEEKRALDDSDNASSANEGSWKTVKRRKEGKEEEDEIEEREDSSTLKKPRVVWSVELHQQFVAAVNHLGVDKAVPKKILELMNVPGLTRENVASHLQKYRLYLRRVSAPQHQSRFDTAFTGATEAAFGSSSSLDGFDLQALAVSGQLSPQSLMTMHAGASRVANSATGISAVDQIGFFNSDAQIANSSRIRSASGQLLNNKQMNFLCGPSTSMESTQLGQSQQAVQSYGNMGLQVSEGTSGFLNFPPSLRTCSSFPGGTINGHPSNSFVMQMTQRGQQFSLSQQQNHVHIDMQRQPQLRGQLHNGLAGEHNTVLSSTIGQHILSNEISGHVSGRGGSTINGNTSLPGTYVNTSSYGVVPQAQFAEFENSRVTESAGNCYPLVSTMGASSYPSTGMFQETVPATGSGQTLSNSTSVKGVDFIRSYDIFSELRQTKSPDWKLQNINLSYESAQHLGSKQNNIDFGFPNSAHQDFNATLKNDSGRNTCTVRKEIISVRTEIERKVGCIAQNDSTFLVENPVRVKAESMPDPSGRDVLFSDNIIPNELMSVIVRQQQEGVGEGETEFNFDGYPLDDISV